MNEKQFAEYLFSWLKDNYPMDVICFQRAFNIITCELALAWGKKSVEEASTPSAPTPDSGKGGISSDDEKCNKCGGETQWKEGWYCVNGCN